MAASKTPSIKTLSALGAERLAELLIELSAADPAMRRRLRLELAGQAGGAEMAHEIKRRIATLAKARSFVEGPKLKALADDLATQHQAIVGPLAKADPVQALDLLWRLLELVDPTMQRCDDNHGRIRGVFLKAAADLPTLAQAAAVDPHELARNTFGALRRDSYGQFDGIVGAMAEVLGPTGLARLKQYLQDWEREPHETPPQDQRRVIGYGSRGPIYADEVEAHHRRSVIERGLRDVADALGDVDAFISRFGDQARRIPANAADIAERLLKAGRPEEAWRVLEGVDRDRLRWDDLDWQQVVLEVLQALGQFERAQTFRWNCFTNTLEASHLRAYLKGLPDFDDVEAESRAMDLALTYPEVHEALDFMIRWPALDRASALILARFDELNGDYFDLLTPAGEALETRYPLAATLARRAMIDFALENGRATRYRHAARHLAECAAVAGRVADFGRHMSHEAYQQKLRAEHERKAGFWDAVDAQR